MFLSLLLVTYQHCSKADTFHGQSDLSECLFPERFICSWNAVLSDFIQTKAMLH